MQQVAEGVVVVGVCRELIVRVVIRQPAGEARNGRRLLRAIAVEQLGNSRGANYPQSP